MNGFWSLTMYDANYFFVPNPLKRSNLSQRNKLKTNADGSVDLLIQHESILDGTWKVPRVHEAS